MTMCNVKGVACAFKSPMNYHFNKLATSWWRHLAAYSHQESVETQTELQGESILELYSSYGQKHQLQMDANVVPCVLDV